MSAGRRSGITAPRDFLHMVGEQELRHVKLLEYELGDPERDRDVYHHVSSIYHLANATTPCFLIQGEGRYPGSSSRRRT